MIPDFFFFANFVQMYLQYTLQAIATKGLNDVRDAKDVLE